MKGQSNVRIDIHQPSAVKLEEKYYIIEFNSNGKWYQLVDQCYIPEYEFGQNSACGECWQKTGQHGMYDLAYAKEYCNKLNDALRDGSLKCKFEIEQFRIASVEWTFKKQVIAPDRY